MAFTSLVERLKIPAGQPGYIPKVLAGPILRKVTSQSVTVWLALRSSCKVSLAVSTIPGVPVMNWQRTPSRLGRIFTSSRLQPNPGKEMEEDTVYQYELSFSFKDSSQPMKLSDATAEVRR